MRWITLIDQTYRERQQRKKWLSSKVKVFLSPNVRLNRTHRFKAHRKKSEHNGAINCNVKVLSKDVLKTCLTMEGRFIQCKNLLTCQFNWLLTMQSSSFSSLFLNWKMLNWFFSWSFHVQLKFLCNAVKTCI